MQLQPAERAAVHLFKWLVERVMIPPEPADANKYRRAGIPPYKVPRLRETSQLQRALDLARYPAKGITLQALKIAYERTLLDVSQSSDEDHWRVSERLGDYLDLPTKVAHYLFGKHQGTPREQAARVALNVAQYAYFQLGLKLEKTKKTYVVKFGKKSYFGIADGFVVADYCNLASDLDVRTKEEPAGKVTINSPELLTVYNGALATDDPEALYAAEAVAWILHISGKDLLVGLHPYTLAQSKVSRYRHRKQLSAELYEQGVYLLINSENPAKALYLLLCPEVIGSKEFVKRFSNPFTKGVVRPQTRLILRDRLDLMYLEVGK